MLDAPIRRSDLTKEAILTAARARFSSDGYERATIRIIAADAKIDPSMVMRYFGNKEGLFAAAAVLELGLPDLSKVARSAVGTTLVGHFLDRWARDEGLRVLFRTAMTHEAAATRLRDSLVAELVPIITRLGQDPARAPARAGMITAQLLGLALARDILRVESTVAMSRSELVAWVGPTIQRYLLGM